ncbi:MAG: hypothetical protein GC200_09070 [Tepidisphaera sp.]|nr:hypothetical protein [Tepidisphaera sp.]
MNSVIHRLDYRTIIVFVGAIALAPMTAVAQDAPETQHTTVTEVNELFGPQDLPGRPKAPREAEPEIPAQPAAAEAPKPEERSWFGGKPYWQWDRATGDWGGGRTWLIDHGFTVEGSYVQHWSSVWDGGARNVASTRHVFDINATADLDKMFGLTGATLYADAYFASNRGGSRDVGDVQGISNIDTGINVNQLAELWYQQKLFDDVLRLKVGKIDANGEFDFVNAAGDFLTSSAGFSPTINGFPTYPAPATGVVAFVYPVKNAYISGGVFDGATRDGYFTGNRGPDQFFSDDKSSSWFFIGEAGCSWDDLFGLGAGRAAVGGHYHTGRATTFNGDSKAGASGVYALAEQQLFAPGTSDEEKARGLFAFGQFGWTEDSVSPSKFHVAGGLMLKGTFPSRDEDTTGVYVSYDDLSDAAGSPYTSDETAIEVYYKIHLTPFINITPDFVYIVNPGGQGLDDATIGQLRVEVLF